MGKIYKLEPRELFWLGKLAKGNYVDYDYIEMLPDIQQKSALVEHETIGNLVKKGYLSEDFSGNIEMDLWMQSLIGCVFQGDYEIDIQLLDLKKQITDRRKLHFYKEQIAQVRIEKGMLYLEEGKEFLLEQKQQILDTYVGAGPAQIRLDQNIRKRITHLLQIRNMKLGKSSVGHQLVKIDETWYSVEEEESLCALKKEDMAALWEALTAGGQENGIL